MNTLEIDSVRLSFSNFSREQRILTDCYLNCVSGEIIGVLGRNGCGKSSLFKIIFGSLNPANKLIRINGEVCSQPFKKKLVGYIPQVSIFPGDFTVNKLLKFLFGKERLESIKSYERIESILKTKIRKLSGGELKYLEVLTMLHMNHPFILLDEPFSGVEPIYQKEIQVLLKSNPQNKGILLTDHNYRNILEVSDRLYLLREGVLKHVTDFSELELYGYVPSGTFGK
ncbi:ATP-binding cassette domain-containing protein [Albibacterium indicum]|uniref:ATP-binding cassette domain-containing protein n=1 Tax=Albibacterium indicum TaxID=2292082 RepID=UPI000E536456|nr:ATP-binding cassette domain-containing protein [Pedobacter indicus]